VGTLARPWARTASSSSMTSLRPWRKKIQAALKGITDKPVRFIINTHYHGDHTGGNAYFPEAGPHHRAR